MANVTIQVTDQFGGYVNCTQDIVTGLLFVRIYDARMDEEPREYWMDPNDPEVKTWLKEVFPNGHLDLLNI